MSKIRWSESRMWTVGLVLLAFVWLGQGVVFAELKVSPANVSAAKFPRIGGHWVGRITDSVNGSGTLVLLIQQTDQDIVGSFDAPFSNAADAQTGSLRGSVAGATNTVSFNLKPNTIPGCVYAATKGTIVSATEFKGNYLGNRFCGNNSGSFDVTREHP